MIQEVKGRSLEGWLGIAVALGVVLALWLLAKLLTVLQAYIGYTAASFSLWGLGALMALWILRTFILGYRYELNGEELKLGRLYGRRMRFMDRVLLRQAAAWGTLEEMKRRFPEASVERAVRKDCPIEQIAVAFRGEGIKIICLQPNEELKQAIQNAVKDR